MATVTKFVSSFVRHLKPDRVKSRGLGTLELPKPELTGGLGLMEALTQRRSGREFSPLPLPGQVLSNLLWAANGINRTEETGRTAPSAMNAQNIDIYAVFAAGVYLYDAKTQSLRLVADVDARRVTGYQDFVDQAPLDLVYVSDAAHMSAVGAQERAVLSAVGVGAIAQNVYLYCAAAGLTTVVRAWFDKVALAAALGLTADEHVVLTQTVGYPKVPV